jgi:peptide/nickel transport system permease protein
MSAPALDLAVEGAPAARRRLRLGPVLRRPSAIAGALLVLAFVLLGLLAPVLEPYSPRSAIGLSQITPTHIPGPSADHVLGLDQNGRDELSRLLGGARSSLIIGVLATSVGILAGVILGTLGGALGGWWDVMIMRGVDVLMALPGLLFAIGIAAALGKSDMSLILAIAVICIPTFARLLRATLVGERERDYVLALRSLGIGRTRIVLRHLLPNSISPVVVQGTLTLATAIIDAAALAFLGLGGDDPSKPEWGRMLSDSQDLLAVAPRLAFLPCGAIVLAALGFTLLGEALREALDPKLRR